MLGAREEEMKSVVRDSREQQFSGCSESCEKQGFTPGKGLLGM